MRNYDSEMYNFVRLAEIAHQKQQEIGLVKFLILAGVAACRAGYLDVAEKCHRIVVTNNPRHLLAQHETLPEALQSEDFKPFVKQLERYCSSEKAEFLLDRLETEQVHSAEEVKNVREASIKILDGIAT